MLKGKSNYTYQYSKYYIVISLFIVRKMRKRNRVSCEICDSALTRKLNVYFNYFTYLKLLKKLRNSEKKGVLKK